MSQRPPCGGVIVQTRRSTPCVPSSPHRPTTAIQSGTESTLVDWGILNTAMNTTLRSYSDTPATGSSLGRPLRIWYINHYADRPPEGRSGRPGFLAQELTALGHEVSVIAASRHHLRASELRDEEVDRLIPWDGGHFLFLGVPPRQGGRASRFWNMWDFSRQLGKLNQRIRGGELESPDVIIASSAHLLVYKPALRLARAHDAKIIFEVRDIWPLSLVEIAGVHRWHPVVKFMESLERHAYRTADAVVSLMPNALGHMKPRGLAPERFHWIPNGVRSEEWQDEPAELPAEHAKAFASCREAGKLAVVYTGAHGPPNALEQLLDLAAEGAPGSERTYHLILIGDGISRDALIAEANRRKIEFITFLPAVTKPQAHAAIARADACFIGWQDRPIYRYGVSANKLFEYLMAAKPVVHAIDGFGDPVQASGAGITVKPYDARKLDEAFRRLAALSPQEREAMGEKGREHVLHRYDWRSLGAQYAALCESLVSPADAT